MEESDRENKLGIGEVNIRINNMKDKFYVVVKGHDISANYSDQSRFEVLKLVLDAIAPDDEEKSKEE